jgi:hypothetical protein
VNRNAHKQIHTVKDDSSAVWIVLYRDSFVLLPDSLGKAVRFLNFSKKFSFRMSQMRIFATIYYERINWSTMNAFFNGGRDYWVLTNLQ